MSGSTSLLAETGDVSYVDEDGRTHLTYWLYTDPGGSIPNWIANKANTISLPDVMRAIAKRAEDPTWKDD